MEIKIGVGSTIGVTGHGETRDVIPPAFFARMRKEVVFLGAKGVDLLP